MRLYHVSEDSEIETFAPRVSPSLVAGVTENVVWAVDDSHLVNYLLPRDCPRLGFYALPTSKEADIERLLGPSKARHVVAIESSWFQRVVDCVLWVYEFSDAHFEAVDIGAGYFISRRTEVPIARHKIKSPIRAILERGAEFRVVPGLWPLRESVVGSTLQFSCIRIRDARPQPIQG